MTSLCQQHEWCSHGPTHTCIQRQSDRGRQGLSKQNMTKINHLQFSLVAVVGLLFDIVLTLGV